MRHVPAIDATGLHALQDVFDKAKRDGTALVLAGVNAQPLEVLEQSGFVKALGRENMAQSLDAALTRARELC